MRLLRALAHLVLALALVSGVTAQAWAVTRAPAPATAPQEHHGHHAAATGVEQAAHDHGSSASEHPLHERGNCQTLCCFTAAQLPTHAPEASAVEFFCSVRYVIDAEPASGRAVAPDPGVPKHLS